MKSTLPNALTGKPIDDHWPPQGRPVTEESRRISDLIVYRRDVLGWTFGRIAADLPFSEVAAFQRYRRAKGLVTYDNGVQRYVAAAE